MVERCKRKALLSAAKGRAERVKVSFVWLPTKRGKVPLMGEIRRSPVEVGSLSHYLQGFIVLYIPGG